MSTLTDVMRTLDEAEIDEERWGARREEFYRIERQKKRLYEAYQKMEERKRNRPMARLFRRLFG